MLITMVTYDTPENKRAELTLRTYNSLRYTVDMGKHRLVISDNGSTDPCTLELLSMCESLPELQVIRNGKNLGTAKAVNKGWKFHLVGEHVCKIDNDVVIRQKGWADQIEEMFQAFPQFGLLGLKRKDLEQRPDNTNTWYRTKLLFAPHKPGDKWLVVEESEDIMGTCIAFSNSLFSKIGYLYQGPWLYGFEDNYSCHRAHIAGFRTGFLPTIEIDHIDPGGTDFTTWKHDHAYEHLEEYRKWVKELHAGKLPIYHGPEDD